jgi:hypothetical protein
MTRHSEAFDVTIFIGASHLHHAFPSHVMPVVDGPEGIENGKKGIQEILCHNIDMDIMPTSCLPVTRDASC